MENPLARRFPAENQIFAPINALEEESAIVAQNARDLEHQLNAAVAASPYHIDYIENVGNNFYDRGHSAIRSAAYLGWKTAEQSTLVVQAAGGVLGCAILLRMIIALRRNEHDGTGIDKDFTLRPWFARGWKKASTRDERSETEDRRNASPEEEDETVEEEEQEEEDDDETLCETWSSSEDEIDEASGYPPRVPNAVWWTMHEGLDRWSVRTAEAKARSHIAHALAKGIVAFRALYEPLEDVSIANWDLREILHLFEHSSEPPWTCTEADAEAARRLAVAAGEACGAVRRLLDEVRRIVALMHVALMSLTSLQRRRYRRIM